MYIITTTNSYCIIWLSLLFVVFIPCSRKSPVGVNASTISKIILCINLVPSFKFFSHSSPFKISKNIIDFFFKCDYASFITDLIISLFNLLKVNSKYKCPLVFLNFFIWSYSEIIHSCYS